MLRLDLPSSPPRSMRLVPIRRAVRAGCLACEQSGVSLEEESEIR